ncbi:MAG TPA: protein kinase [Vicinamibacteria bacterium]|nr:protein kinase [Vicinamibacteria bacterium]
MDLQAGNPLPQIPGGRYHIVERLAAGAIGGVYKALDTILDRPVAVKCINLDTPFADHSPDELRERFVREARIAARLQHPNIVTIYDIVATSDRGFIIMEFIEGQSLESLFAERKRLPMPDALHVLTQLAGAIDYAHSRNVVHRDVKPVNILVSPSLWVWVTDFGIAKSELSTNLTMAGGVLGTPDYMSPEQAKGEDVDARSDLFSLGCILFECVTGEKPFRSPSLTGVLLSIINDEPVFPLNWRSLGLPNGLKPILHHALEKNREKRYPTGAELVAALAALEGSARLPAAVSVPAPEVAETAAPEPEKPTEEEAAPAETEPAAAPEPEAQTALAKPTKPAATAEPAEAEASEPAGVDTGATIFAAPAPAESPEESEVDSQPEESPEQTVIISAGRPPEPAPPQAPTVDPARIEALKEEARPLRLSPNLSSELQGAVISPEEGFLLSRIDGLARASDILAMSPMPEAETATALLHLIDKDLIQFGGKAPARDPGRVASPPPSPAPLKGVPDEATVREVDRLLALSKSGAYSELLGVAADASAGARKSAYLKIIGKFHPDKFPRATEDIREKLSRLCAESAEALDQLASPTESKSASGSSNGGNGYSPGSRTVSSFGRTQGPHFDKRRYARELYDRSLRAFDMQDFWESTQLCRQAIENDETQAEYFNLLGRALMQNKKWRKEAADSFRRASELEPGNLAHLGMLGAVYKAEGLQARAAAILKKAQSLDPSFALPEIDGEVSVEAG